MIWPHSRPITIIAYSVRIPLCTVYVSILIFIHFDLCLNMISVDMLSLTDRGLPCDAFHIVFAQCEFNRKAMRLYCESYLLICVHIC